MAETKNGAVVRKLFGYAHIPQRHAVRFITFCVEFLNPFLNFHRPCLFATDKLDPKKPACTGHAGRVRGQRGYTLPTAQPFDHMPTAFDHMPTAFDQRW